MSITNFSAKLFACVFLFIPFITYAATPVVDTTISVEATGSDPFDGTTWSGDGTGIPGADAGTDSTADNNVVRVQDSITYRVEVSVNDSAVEDLTATVTLNEKQTWIEIPTGCKTDAADVGNQPVSSISADGTMLFCNMGPAIEGTTRLFFPVARAIGSDPLTGAITQNDDTVGAQVSSTAYSAANGVSAAATDGPTETIVTGFFRLDLVKELAVTDVDPVTFQPLYQAPAAAGITGRDGILMEYTIRARYPNGSLLADGDDVTNLANYTIVDAYTDDNQNNVTGPVGTVGAPSGLSTGGVLYTWDATTPACELLGSHGGSAAVTCSQLVSAIDDVGPGGLGPDGVIDPAIQIELTNIDVTDPDSDGNLFEIRLHIWFDEVLDVTTHQNCAGGGTCTNTVTNRVGLWDGVSTTLDAFDESNDLVADDGLNDIVSTEDASGNNVPSYNAGQEPFPNEISYPMIVPPTAGWSAGKEFSNGFPFATNKFPDQTMAAGETRPFTIRTSDFRTIDDTVIRVCEKIDTEVFEFAGLAPPNQIGSPRLSFGAENRPFNPVLGIRQPGQPTMFVDGSAHFEYLYTNIPHGPDPIADQAGYITAMRTNTCENDLNGDGFVIILDEAGDKVDENGDAIDPANALLPIDWWRDSSMVPPVGGGAGSPANVTRFIQDRIYPKELILQLAPSSNRLDTFTNYLITSKLISTSPYGSDQRLPNFISANTDVDADGVLDGAWREGDVGLEDPTADGTFSIDPDYADRMTLVAASHNIAKRTDPEGIRVVRGGDEVDYVLSPRVFGLWNDAFGTTSNIDDNLPNGVTYIANSEMFSADNGATWLTRAQWDAAFTAGTVDVEITTAPNSAGDDPLRWNFDSVNSPAPPVKPVGDQLPLIRYTIVVDPSVVSGTFNNRARINSSDNIDGGVRREARYEIQVLPEFGLDLFKQVDQPVYTTNTAFSYDLIYKNLGGEDYTAGSFIDILPYVGDNAPTTGGILSPRDPASSITGTFEISAISRSNGEIFFATGAAPAMIEEDPCHASNLPAGFDPSVGTNLCSAYFQREGMLPGGGALGTNSTGWVQCTALSPVACPGLTPETITAIRFEAPSLPAAAGGQTVTIELTPTGNLGGEPNLVNNEVTSAATGDIFTNTFAGRIPEISLNVISNDVSVTFVSGSIGDTVWFDLDSDGNGPVGAGDGSDTTEPPIIGATVELLDNTGMPIYVSPAGGIVDASFPGAVPLTTMTNSSGQYLFDNLPPDNYQIRVTPPTGAVPTYDDDGIGTPNISSHTLVTELDPTGELLDVEDQLDQDFGYLPPVQIGSTVWLDSNNSGTQDGAEAGIGGVTVQLFAATANPLTDPPLQTTVTDSTPGPTLGNYLFSTVPGDYFVYIPTPPVTASLSSTPDVTNTGDNAIDSDDNGIQANAGDPVRSPDINLAYNSEPLDADETGQGGMQDPTVFDSYGNMTVDFGFLAPYSVGSVAFSDDNDNGVQDIGETGIDGIGVRLFDSMGVEIPVGADGILGTGDDGPGGMVTSGGGQYNFSNLPPDDYQIQFTPTANLLPSSVQVPDPDAAGDVNLDSNLIVVSPTASNFTTGVFSLGTAAEPVVELDPNGVQEVDPSGTPNANSNLTVDAGFVPMLSLGNIVWEDIGTINSVYDSGTDTPIQGATVNLLQLDTNAASPTFNTFVQVATQTTLADGLYNFANLYPGDYQVEVIPPAQFIPVPTQVADPDGVSGTGDTDNDSNIDTTVTNAGVTSYTSGTVTLSVGDEPASGVDGDGANGNQAVDFGFYQNLTLGSVVFLDDNGDGTVDSTDGNGTQDVGESGINGATVSLFLVDPTDSANLIPVTVNADGVYQTTQTGANNSVVTSNLISGVTVPDGSYNFSNLPAGEYVVQVTPPAGTSPSPVQEPNPETGTNLDSNIDTSVTGLTPGTWQSGVIDLGAGNSPQSPAEQDSALTNEIDPSGVNTITDGNADLTVDFGFVPELSIGSFVWEDSNGDGIQDANEPPLAGSQVTLWVDDGNGTNTFIAATNNTGATVGSVTVGSDGLYLFENLPVGDYRVQVTPPSGVFPSPIQTVADNDSTENDSNIASEPSTGVYESGIITLTAGGSPTETGTMRGDTQDDAGIDANGNMTVDFGFVPPASLGNYVWLDLDMDGVQDANEDGIANVTVKLYADADGDGVISGAELTTPVSTATTGPNGEYLFSDLEPGVVYQTGVDTSTLPAGLVQTFDEGDGLGATDSLSDPIVLDPNEFHDTADFGYAPPAGLGAVGDTIWIDADDDGVQDPGEPGISGVTVSITPPSNIDLGAGPGVPITTVTDSNGNYLFPNLPLDQTYIVEVDTSTLPTGYMSGPSNLGDPDVRDGNSTAADDQTTVVVTTENPVNLDLDFGYVPPADQNNSIGDIIWLDVDEDGNGPAGAGDSSDTTEPGIAGVTVTLIQDNGDGIFNPADDTVIATTITDANGMYVFTGLPDGDYLVSVTDQNNVLAGLNQTVDSDDPANPGAFSASTPNISFVDDLGVGIATPDIDSDQDFGYTEPNGTGGDGVIGDTIFFDQDGSGGPDAGEGVEGVVVQLFGPGPDGVIGGGDDVLIGSTTTDANGNYLFTGLDTSDTGPNPGTDYQVVVDTSTLPNGGSGWTNSVDPNTAGTGDSESVTTLTSATPEDLAQDFGYVGDDNNSISGTVWPDTDGNGEQGEAGSFAGVTIELRDDNGNVIATTTTDSSGNYEFANLPDGMYTVVVTDNDNVLNGFEHTDSPNGSSDTGDQTSKDDTGYTVDLDSAGASSTPVSDSTSDFGYMPIITNPISLGSFKASATGEGQVRFDWSTQTEVANLGFKLYGRVADEWVLLNDDLVLGQGDSVSTQFYELAVNTNAEMFAIADVDLTGTETLHGPFRLGKSYGGVSDARVIDWAAEKAAREQKAEKRAMKRKQQQKTRLLKRAQKQLSQ